MILKHLLVATLLGAAASPLAAQNVHAGIEAWQRADYAAAVSIWRPLAEKGDADAEFNLGQAYRLGRGVPINLSAATTWFQRAAAKGHVDAQTTLGLMLFENGDRAGGIRWLKLAADKGDPRAMLIYGTALFNGDGVNKDPILGYAFVSRAASLGLSPAQSTLEQLDQILPAEQRKKAFAIAAAKTKALPTGAKAVRAPKATASTAKPTKAAPPPTPARAPKQTETIASAAGGGWRIQLGAFAQHGSAEALFKRLSGTIGGKQPFYSLAGAVTRLQVGPYASRTAAAAACAALSARGQACFPVTAK
jgi:cell division septation protein DedD